MAAVEAVAAVARGLEVGVEHGAAAPRPPHHHTSTPGQGDRYRYVMLVDCTALQLGPFHPGAVPKCHYCIVLFLESSIIQFCSHLLLADNAITGDPYT